jgi:hypothetical protein
MHSMDYEEESQMLFSSDAARIVYLMVPGAGD